MSNAGSEVERQARESESRKASPHVYDAIVYGSGTIKHNGRANAYAIARETGLPLGQVRAGLARLRKVSR